MLLCRIAVQFNTIQFSAVFRQPLILASAALSYPSRVPSNSTLPPFLVIRCNPMPTWPRGAPLPARGGGGRGDLPAGRRRLRALRPLPWTLAILPEGSKRATSVNVQLPAEGPACGLDFARCCEFPLRALQVQKWHVDGSRTCLILFGVRAEERVRYWQRDSYVDEYVYGFR